MPQNYTGSSAGVTARQNVTISEPVGTDVRNSASVRTPLEYLADIAQYLMQKVGLLDTVSTWAAKQAFSAGLSSAVAPTAATDVARKVDIDAVRPVRGRWIPTTPGTTHGGALVGNDGGTTVVQDPSVAVGTFTLTDARLTPSSVFLAMSHLLSGPSSNTTDLRASTYAGSATVVVLTGGAQSNESFSFVFYP